LSSPLPFNLDSWAQNISTLKLRGGLAGKICHVLIFVVVSIAAICCAVRVEWLAFLGIVVIFILPAVMLWRLINLAEKNPQSALMEGAELLLHEQLLIGTKKDPQISVNNEDIIEVGPLELSTEDSLTINKPDQDSPQSTIPSNGDKGGKE